MSNKPLNTFKDRTLQIAQWGSDSFTMSKSWKRKDSDQWVTERINVFKSELLRMRDLIDQAVGMEEKEPLSGKLSEQLSKRIEQSSPAAFQDDDIPF